MERLPQRFIPYLLVILGSVIFFPFLGLPNLFDWDEINFAEVAREMVATGNYSQPQMRFLPFWEKPPLFFWLQAGAMNLFGVGEFAARLPNAIAGLVTLPFLYSIGKKLYDTNFGLMWAIIYLGSLLPGLYFQSGIIDPVFNLFIFSGLWFIIQYIWRRNNEQGIRLEKSIWWYLFAGGSLIGLAVLTKGPAAFIIICLCLAVYWVIVRFRMFISVFHFIILTVTVVAVSGLWYGTESILHGTWFIEKFIAYNFRLLSTEDAGHGGFFGYHFVVVFIGCFPASVFMLKALFKNPHENNVRFEMKRWMLILLWVVLLLFSLVQSKIIHYSSLTYFPVTYLAALYLWQLVSKGMSINKVMITAVLSVGILISTLLIAFPLLGMNIEWLQAKIADPFAKANLNADAQWTGWEVVAGILLLASTLLSVYFFRKARLKEGIFVLFIGNAFALKLAMILIVPKVEAYTQRAAIDIFKELEGQDVYVAPIGYKTYADAFYQRLDIEHKPKLDDYSDKQQKQDWERWLMQGDIDKPAYFITRNDKKTSLNDYSDIILLKEKNGFLLYKRTPQKIN